MITQEQYQRYINRFREDIKKELLYIEEQRNKILCSDRISKIEKIKERIKNGK